MVALAITGHRLGLSGPDAPGRPAQLRAATGSWSRCSRTPGSGLGSLVGRPPPRQLRQGPDPAVDPLRRSRLGRLSSPTSCPNMPGPSASASFSPARRRSRHAEPGRHRPHEGGRATRRGSSLVSRPTGLRHRAGGPELPLVQRRRGRTGQPGAAAGADRRGFVSLTAAASDPIAGDYPNMTSDQHDLPAQPPALPRAQPPSTRVQPADLSRTASRPPWPGRRRTTNTDGTALPLWPTSATSRSTSGPIRTARASTPSSRAPSTSGPSRG